MGSADYQFGQRISAIDANWREQQVQGRLAPASGQTMPNLAGVPQLAPAEDTTGATAEN
jgi:hypothetical protein